MCNQCRSALTAEQKMAVFNKLADHLKWWQSQSTGRGNLAFTESFQNCLKILFPRGLEP